MNVKIEARGRVVRQTENGQTKKFEGHLNLNGSVGDITIEAVVRNGKGYQEPERIPGNVLQLRRRVGQEALALGVDAGRAGREAQTTQMVFDSSLTRPTVVGVQRDEDGKTLVGGEVSISRRGEAGVVIGRKVRGEIKIRTGGR